MNYFGYPQAELEAAGGLWTAREISQQPLVWQQIEEQVGQHTPALQSFLQGLLQRPDLRIILTGAGTSAFIGECLSPALKQLTQRRVEAVATTDLVGSPGTWLESGVPTLLVSFARSGNSPESMAAVDLAEQRLRERYHLIITCDPNGRLCRQGRQMQNARVVLLPEATNDRGFAMTSSFTGMILATQVIFGVPVPSRKDRERAVTYLLDSARPYIQGLVQTDFERVVYLGAQEFKGLARESALKMLELTDGDVVALAETPLGFRHGPKTIVNDRTLIVMFLSNDQYARQYEMDLLRELRADGVAARVIALSAGQQGGTSDQELILPLPASAPNLSLCLCFAVFVQSLAFLRSLSLKIRPDTPNARGVVNRVVQGVRIYPWTAGR